MPCHLATYRARAAAIRAEQSPAALAAMYADAIGLECVDLDPADPGADDIEAARAALLALLCDEAAEHDIPADAVLTP